jgi:hypothetical protein
MGIIHDPAYFLNGCLRAYLFLRAYSHYRMLPTKEVETAGGDLSIHVARAKARRALSFCCPPSPYNGTDLLGCSQPICYDDPRFATTNVFHIHRAARKQ